MRNYSKVTRDIMYNMLEQIKNFIKSVYDKASISVNEDTVTYHACCDLMDVLKFNQTQDVYDILSNMGQRGNYNFKISQVLIPLIIVQLYTDLYRRLIYKYKLVGGEELFPNISNLLKERSSISYAQVLMMFNNSSLSRLAILSSIEFMHLSTFDKILQIKSLSDVDCSKLKNINPLFENEKEIYDIVIDIDFIIKQITKLKNGFKDDLEKGYDESVEFLFKLYKIRPNELKKLVLELVKYNEENDLKNLKMNSVNEETINIEGIILTKNELKKLIKKCEDLYDKNKMLDYKK